MKKNTKEDWLEFRQNILLLQGLYKQVLCFSEVYKENQKEIDDNIKEYYQFSRNNALCAFFIKTGFLIANGQPTLKTFMSHEDYNKLNSLYKNKIKTVRDGIYAHNSKSKVKQITDDDVQTLMSEIIKAAKIIDESFGEISVHYEELFGDYTIENIIPLIKSKNELFALKKEILEKGGKAQVEFNISTNGKFKIIEILENK